MARRNPIERLEVIPGTNGKYFIARAQGRHIIKVAGGPFPSKEAAEKTKRNMLKRYRNPKGNPRMIRMGRLVEIRYERDHGRRPGYYKHPFKTAVDIYSDGNSIIAKPVWRAR